MQRTSASERFTRDCRPGRPKADTVLDGQQRLTSMLIGLRGSFTVKAKREAVTVPVAWQRKRLSTSICWSIHRRYRRARTPKMTLSIPTVSNFRKCAPEVGPGELPIAVGEILNYIWNRGVLTPSWRGRSNVCRLRAIDGGRNGEA